MSDEITNDELRLQIAPALGYIDNGVTNDDTHEFYLLSAEGRQYFYINGLPGADAPLPNWLEDIAAAWKLFQQMAAVIPYISLYGTGRRWRVDAAPFGIHICADTAERAICLAFLQWKRGQP